MNLFGELVELWTTENSTQLRDQYAKRYRQLVGVHPSQCELFRDGLLRIRADGGMSVVDLIAAVDSD